jgi:hypothetical protein
VSQLIEKYKHEWKFDLPWHMVSLKDWFYMVNVGYFGGVFLHVRVLGIRSLWTFPEPENCLIPLRACVSGHCGWAGKESACLTYKHAGDERLCPHCYDNTELISLSDIIG